MDSEEIVGAFFSGLVTSPLINTLFPIIVSMTITNSESLPFFTKWLLRMLPFVLLLVLFFTIIDSIESFVAGILGVVFSIAVFGGIGIVGMVTITACFVVVAAKISQMQ